MKRLRRAGKKLGGASKPRPGPSTIDPYSRRPPSSKCTCQERAEAASATPCLNERQPARISAQCEPACFIHYAAPRTKTPTFASTRCWSAQKCRELDMARFGFGAPLKLSTFCDASKKCQATGREIFFRGDPHANTRSTSRLSNARNLRVFACGVPDDARSRVNRTVFAAPRFEVSSQKSPAWSNFTIAILRRLASRQLLLSRRATE